MVQNNGMKPRTMVELEGKVIPMRTAGGRIVFRTAKNVGKRKITARNELGQIVSSKMSWRHPGLKPKNFLEHAIQQAVGEWVQTLSPRDLGNLSLALDLDVVKREVADMLQTKMKSS